jgi:kanamycin kinase
MQVVPSLPLPTLLADRYAGWHRVPIETARAVTIVSRLEGPSGERHYVKVAPVDWPITVRAEHERMRWARGFLPVPEIVEFGTDGAVEWLITEAIDAPDGTDPALLAQPEPLVRALARGLRRFHDATDPRNCPFDFTLETAIPHVERRVREGLVLPEDFHAAFSHLTPAAALERILATRPRSEDLVVSHGDYCFPNALLRDWEVVAFVDLGELAVADRWWDVAVASWSTTWNVGPGYEEMFIREYGLEPDAERLAFYRLLYDLRA